MKPWEMEVEIDYVGKETLKIKVDRSTTIAALIDLAAEQMDIPRASDVSNPVNIGTIRLIRRHEVSG